MCPDASSVKSPLDFPTVSEQTMKPFRSASCWKIYKPAILIFLPISARLTNRGGCGPSPSDVESKNWRDFPVVPFHPAGMVFNPRALDFEAEWSSDAGCN
jgi:hypothetical protein